MCVSVTFSNFFFSEITFLPTDVSKGEKYFKVAHKYLLRNAKQDKERYFKGLHNFFDSVGFLGYDLQLINGVEFFGDPFQINNLSE